MLDRAEFAAAFGSALVAQPMIPPQQTPQRSPGETSTADFASMEAARNHIRAAIKMGYEVIRPAQLPCPASIRSYELSGVCWQVVEQLTSQQLFDEVTELRQMIQLLEHPLQGAPRCY